MKLSVYEWVDSLGYTWHTVQNPKWAEVMRADGFYVTHIQVVVE